MNMMAVNSINFGRPDGRMALVPITKFFGPDNGKRAARAIAQEASDIYTGRTLRLEKPLRSLDRIIDKILGY